VAAVDVAGVASAVDADFPGTIERPSRTILLGRAMVSPLDARRRLPNAILAGAAGHGGFRRFRHLNPGTHSFTKPRYESYLVSRPPP
jgi:hypothetical protein